MERYYPFCFLTARKWDKSCTGDRGGKEKGWRRLGIGKEGATTVPYNAAR